MFTISHERIRIQHQLDYFEYVFLFKRIYTNLSHKHYIIVDMGEHDKEFVEQEFEIFMLMRMVVY